MAGNKKNRQKTDAGNQKAGLLRKRLDKMAAERDKAIADLEQAMKVMQEMEYNIAGLIAGKPFPDESGEMLKVMPARMQGYALLESRGELFNALPISMHPQVRNVKALTDMLFETALAKLEEKNKDTAVQAKAKIAEIQQGKPSESI